MNEIRFNAWNSYENKMYYWSEICQKDSKGHLTLTNLLNGLIDHMTPLPYSGLKDKFSGGIYKGHLLNKKTTFENNMADRRFQKNTIIEVGFSNGCFIDKATGVTLVESLMSISSFKKTDQWTEYEIIGSIYENPELLK